MSEIKLLPCPFCGGEAKVIENNCYTDIHSVMCKNCFSESDRYHTQDEAIEAWNTRKPMQEVDPVVHGRWLINCDSYYPYCSVCKEESGHIGNYCPNCGAKMDLEEN